MKAPATTMEELQMRCDHLVERNGLLRHILSEIRRISAPEPDSCAHDWLILTTRGHEPVQVFRFCTECRHVERVA